MVAKKRASQKAPEPHPTFDDLVVGPANRLASAAGRRAAESPGTTYNPLVLYSGPGLGKSHILSAIEYLAKETHPDIVVMSRTSDLYMDEVEDALEFGEAFLDRLTGVGIFILDDLQDMAGHAHAQEMMVRTIDELSGKGAQVVVAANRPPADIEGLDRRLLSRFSDGLVVDIVQPDHETRVRIIRQELDKRSVGVEDGVPEVIGRAKFQGVREMLATVDRLIMKQETEKRSFTPEELPTLLGLKIPVRSRKRSRGLDEPLAPPGADTVGWREQVEELVESARADDIAATPILKLLRGSDPPADWQMILHEFREGASRVRQIKAELHALGNPWPETSAVLLADTERLEEAESLLKSARERKKPFPPIPEGPGLEGLRGRFPALALKAATQLIRADPAEYTPLFVHSESPEKTLELLHAVGRSFREQEPRGRVASLSIPELADQFFHALTEGVAGAWRERWWSADVLLLHEVERLPEAERALDEFFHLCEALTKRGARIVLAATRPPADIQGIPDRLASRLADGLVLDLDEEPEAAEEEEEAEAVVVESESQPLEPDDADDDLLALREFAGVGGPGASPAAQGSSGAVATKAPPLSPERVIWDWPVLEDRIADETSVRVTREPDGD